jgi:hypothetical protein
LPTTDPTNPAIDPAVNLIHIGVLLGSDPPSISLNGSYNPSLKDEYTPSLTHDAVSPLYKPQAPSFFTIRKAPLKMLL